MEKTENDVKVYFVTIPAHKYLHIRNYESIGYWDFWEKQSKIPGQDCDTICGLPDSYGVRLPIDYHGEIPEQMQIMDVPEGEYIVFEHGPFNYQDQNCNVEEKIKEAMKNYDYAASGYCLDNTQGRVLYFYHDPDRFWKYVRPVKKL